jgi:O-antigen/teichoic acid export membrane protein
MTSTLDVLRLTPGLARYFRWLDPDIRRRIASGALWSILGAGFASGLAMLSNVISARFLGATHFGELAIVLATTNLFTTLFTSGLSMTASKYVAEHRDTDPARAGAVVGLSWVTSIAVGLATALLILPFAPWLSAQALGAPGLANAVRLGGIVMLFAALNGSQVGALSGLEAFDQVAYGNLVRGIGTILLVTLGAAAGGVNGALAGYILVGAITAVYYQILVRRQCAARSIHISYQFGREDVSILWRFTLPVLVTTFSFTPAAWWSNVLLAKTSGYSEAGVFGAAFHWQMFITFFSSAVSRIGLPMLSNVRAEQDAAKYKRCLAINFLLTAAPAIAIATPVALAAHFIVSLYGPSFQGGAAALALISLAAVFNAINIPVGHAIWSLDATTSGVLLALLNGAVLAGSAYALSGKGAAGLAGAYVIMGAVQTAVNIPFMIWLLRQRLNSPLPAPEAAVA